ncbi:T9SS type A sorting domain-containing protein [Saccharicrinis sp. GN24d3]|uniref:T9SS type A sorting domain-containing protein n=1 Tax=Saccharicrinis sp. GN24d3 TaxID=3458416 RepID=UPI004036DE13
MKKRFFILGLLALVVCSFIYMMSSLPSETSTLFSGSGNCALCHSGSDGVLINSVGRDVSPIYHWQSSMMGNSAKDPYWLAKVSSEVEENPHLKEMIEDKCATCHAPMGRTEAIYNGQTYYSLIEVLSDPLSQDGVSCTLCHQIEPDNLSSEESFSGNFIVEPLKNIFGPYENPFTVSMVNIAGYTPVHGVHIESSALCATCHTLFTPYVDQDGNVAGYFPEQMPYYEWLNSTYPEQGLSCQKCHMPRVDEDFTISSLPPNLQNKRNPVFEHHFVGGNTVVNSMLKNNYAELGINSAVPNLDTTAYYALKNLKENTVELNANAASVDNMVSVNIELRNKTGHKLPTGFPSRRMWIHFIAKDNQGEIIFESGKYDSQGNILTQAGFEEHHDTISNEDNVQVYEAVLGNAQDEVTTVLLESSQYLKDNRIPPVGFNTDQPYYNLIAITGKANDDVNFNKSEDGVEGSGYDRITYLFPFSGSTLNFSIEVCYQSIKPNFVSHLSESTTDESNRFNRMFNDDNLPKVEVISFLEEQVLFTSIKNIESLAWEIYPNPSNDEVFLNGKFDWPVSYFIYALNGKLISSGKIDHPLISFQNLMNGTYILKLESGQLKKSFKMVCY